ncbi:CoA transferase [Mycobacterium stomatepiae]|uniref:CoA transferase n=1 Tax=Mycobacterium stomatepiae TaxID=470076 RepID=UPI001E3E6D9F|nr:CoA transferase [Mycobacterium stomatepiae]
MSGPLHGVHIVKMGGLGPAPFRGMLLGDLGADVVRVDTLAGVDGPLPIDCTVRRSQRSVAVDGITSPAPAPRFSRTVPDAPSSPSLPGDHTDAVLCEMGLEGHAVTALVDAGVIAQSGDERRR